MRPNDATVIRYERSGELIRVTLAHVTNHELRAVLIGLWCRLDAVDREDHMSELAHYHNDPASYLSPVSAAVKLGGEKGFGIDVSELINRGEKIRP